MRLSLCLLSWVVASNGCAAKTARDELVVSKNDENNKKACSDKDFPKEESDFAATCLLTYKYCVRCGGEGLKNVDLSGKDLSDGDFRGTDFQKNDLEDTNLSGADLRGADLTRAMLRRANLIGANLRDAKLEYAALDNANLRGANLAYAGVQGTYFTGPRTDMRDACLEGMNFRGDSTYCWVEIRLPPGYYCDIRSDIPVFNTWKNIRQHNPLPHTAASCSAKWANWSLSR